jgi:dihydroorotate dehydrogenase (NAD+) catalytic subunit
MGTLAVNLAGIDLRNPILLAAGTCGTLQEMGEVLDLSRVGGLVTKSITAQPREGNPTWRILPHPSATGLGMLNAIGLANPGIETFEREYWPRREGIDCAVVGSVAGFTVEDYVAVAATMAEWTRREEGAEALGHQGTRGSIQAIELNLSCPNVKHGTEFGASPVAAAEVVRAVRAVTGETPLLIKLSPVAPDIAAIARAIVEAAGGSRRVAITIGNTIPAMAIDVETRRPLLANVTGGLSGPAVHAAAVRSVWEVFNKFGRDLHGPGKHLPIVGLGGVMNWRDAAEFILAGATVVGMGTALFADPRAPLKVERGLERWVARQGVGSVGELVGAVRVGT